MKDPEKPATPWSTSPSVKARNAVQRSVTALLDELAPERVVRRIEQLPGAIEQHRTPSGCVLQMADRALSVSWFTDAGSHDYGELHVILWNGTVARKGSTRNTKGATIISELVLRPLEPPADDGAWEGSDGGRYNTVSLVAKCLKLLELGGGTDGSDAARP